jgi:hypothetical protein
MIWQQTIVDGIDFSIDGRMGGIKTIKAGDLVRTPPGQEGNV